MLLSVSAWAQTEANDTLLAAPSDEITAQDAERAGSASWGLNPLPVPPGFHDEYVVLPNGRLHLVIGGSGSPLLLLHGFPETWYEWHEIMPQLAKQHTILAADLPGSGDSTPQPGNYDKKSLAETLYQALSSLGYSQVAIAGHDIGGVVAYAYAALHPESVTRLAIMDVPFPSPDIYTFPALTSEGAGNFWYVGFLNVPQLPEQLITDKEREFIRYFVLHLAAHPENFPQRELATITKQFARPGRKHAGFEYYRALPQDVIDFQFLSQTKLGLPVLAVGGEKSFGASEINLVQAYASNVTGVVVPDSGHWVAEEQPAFLAQALNNFFADDSQRKR